jgi:hypothetical protein
MFWVPKNNRVVIPANPGESGGRAGIQEKKLWIPAFAGKTDEGLSDKQRPLDASAGKLLL